MVLTLQTCGFCVIISQDNYSVESRRLLTLGGFRLDRVNFLSIVVEGFRREFEAMEHVKTVDWKVVNCVS